MSRELNHSSQTEVQLPPITAPRSFLDISIPNPPHAFATSKDFSSPPTASVCIWRSPSTACIMTPLFPFCDSCPQTQLGGSPAPRVVPPAPPYVEANSAGGATRSSVRGTATQLSGGRLSSSYSYSTQMLLDQEKVFWWGKRRQWAADAGKLLLTAVLIPGLSFLTVNNRFFGVLKTKYHCWSSNSSHSCSAILKSAKSKHKSTLLR